MNGAVLLFSLLICLLCAPLNRSQDILKLKKLTSDLVNAIAEANSGKKYGTEWVPALGRTLEEVHRTSSRRCFMFKLLVKKVENFCPKPPTYFPTCYPSCNPPPPPPPAPPPPPPPPPPSPSPSPGPGKEFVAPPHPSFELVYPDGTYFPWCYMPFCPTICQRPYCYPCMLPDCDPNCVPPMCYPPCTYPGCELPPTCWPPYCPEPCVHPKCIAGDSFGAMRSCVPPYCPPPMNCHEPYCPRVYRPVSGRTFIRTGLCPMRDIVKRAARFKLG
ncbi:leucine-rich repeat extensin-like protein 3 [Drosophila subpulchrella]|uniref:leucine-rich repeat extensin-like protein 3 n=1 Tax=Drosophila subpulchrella TaxID=1486046 RepID=UPI0018A140C5|nr:leucine-rich repeat extensin-like protein 3 [Drosophila subpulchrella]